MSNNYSHALVELQKLTKFGINMGLQRISSLLTHLGNPQERVQCLHIGGTNGKGSTCAILAAVLQRAGYRVGSFTSPHLESYTERYTVNGTPIAEDDFARYLFRVLEKYNQVKEETGEAPTEFEVLTALAFLYFAEIQVDILLLEVGLGGDIDSTNVIRQPLLSIITNVTLEHCEYLGDTVEAIAEKKSGIIKEGRPAITASPDERVLEVLRRVAREKQAVLHEIYKETSWDLVRETEEGQIFNLSTPAKERNGLLLALRGQHQLVNGATAVLAVDLLKEMGWQVTEDAIRQGLHKVKWPGRLEKINERPLIILDGAHNPAGLQALALWLAETRKQVSKVILVIGMLDDKGRSAVNYLKPLADLVIITRPSSARAAHWDLLAEYFKDAGKGIYLTEKPREAVAKARALAGENDLILVAGSLYLVGEVRQHLKA